MKYASHSDPNTLPKHYMPQNCADGQAAYHGRPRRMLVLDHFRTLTIPRNPNLWQCLPAKRQHEFARKEDVVQITYKLATNRGRPGTEWQNERKELYLKKRALHTAEIRIWRKNQPIRHSDPPGYYRATFDRVRFMMPERDRLAQNMFEIGTLRSSLGLSVLKDMIVLYRKSAIVEYRPGLELDKCVCGKFESEISYEWRHIYNCHKAAFQESHGFAELCFDCNQWFYGTEAWELHSQHHLDNRDSLSVWCDPLFYGGVLARAGHCPWCLTDEDLPASVRSYQFKTRRGWLEHIYEHKIRLKMLLEDKPRSIRCPDKWPHCPQEFVSVLELEFHLSDNHGIPLAEELKMRKRPTDDMEDIDVLTCQGKRPKLSSCTAEDGDETPDARTEGVFINAVYGLEGSKGADSAPSSRSSTYSWSKSDTLVENECLSSYSTPLSSITSEDLIDPALLAIDINEVN